MVQKVPKLQKGPHFFQAINPQNKQKMSLDSKDGQIEGLDITVQMHIIAKIFDIS